MSTIPINFDREYLFVSKETGEAVIMKVEKLRMVKKTRYNVQYEVQNYIQYEGKPWQKIQMEDFNKLGLDLIAEWNPKSESESEVAIAKVKKLMTDLGIELENSDYYEDMLQVIGEHIEYLIADERYEEEDNYPDISLIGEPDDDDTQFASDDYPPGTIGSGLE